MRPTQGTSTENCASVQLAVSMSASVVCQSTPVSRQAPLSISSTPTHWALWLYSDVSCAALAPLSDCQSASERLCRLQDWPCSGQEPESRRWSPARTIRPLPLRRPKQPSTTATASSPFRILSSLRHDASKPYHPAFRDAGGHCISPRRAAGPLQPFGHLQSSAQPLHSPTLPYG